MAVITQLTRSVREYRLPLLLLLPCLVLLSKLHITSHREDLSPEVISSAAAAAAEEDVSLPASSPPCSEDSTVLRVRSTDPESGSRTVYVVTATYPRPEQEADLVQLAQTLMHAAPHLFWVLVEDAPRRTPAVTALLRRSGLRHVHLLGISPPGARTARFWGRRPRGVSGRNTGLAWLRAHASGGVVYFADDDNTYDIRLFTEIQKTRSVSVFPVGLVTELGVSSPVVVGGRVTGFFDGWPAGRRFQLDMAGFAIAMTLLLQRPNATIPYRAGYEEDGLLRALGVTLQDLQPLAQECSQILVWHTRTEKVAPIRRPDLNRLQGSNIATLMEHLLPKDPGEE